MRSTILGLALALAIVSAPSASANIIPDGYYTLGNHPDGSAAPPLYGLRLDGLFGDTNQIYTFTFQDQLPGTEDDDAMVGMTLSGGTATIAGRVYGGKDTGSGWTDAGYWTLNFQYTLLTDSGCGGAGGDYVDICRFSDNPLNGGSLTRHSDGLEILLREYPNANLNEHTFQLGDENSTHRGFPGLSGWGWLEVKNPEGLKADQWYHESAQDFLFTAVDAPEPGTMILLGTVLAGLGLRRRFSK